MGIGQSGEIMDFLIVSLYGIISTQNFLHKTNPYLVKE
ncbi:MAG: hypothetical protein ACJASP_002342 [Roseivirga sp.]|jgi:hypothetical protein